MRKTTLAAILGAATIGAAGTAHAAGAGDVLIRLRAIDVIPTESSGDILPSFPGEGVSVDNAIVPEVDFTYMLTDYLGFELIAATTKHHVSGKTGTTGGIGTLASSWVLPPTLTLQYHLIPEGKFHPYVGAGVNYTLFYRERASAPLQGAVGLTTVGLKDSIGWAAQAGMDIDVSGNMFFNVDVKYIDMRTTARLNTTALGLETVHVKINPIIVGIGIGYRL
jgi:outer membrane protein